MAWQRGHVPTYQYGTDTVDRSVDAHGPVTPSYLTVVKPVFHRLRLEYDVAALEVPCVPAIVGSCSSSFGRLV